MSEIHTQRQVSRRRPAYWGEDIAAPLLEYLNDSPLKRNDKVETLLRANEALIAGSNTAARKIRDILQNARLKPFFELPMVEKGERWSAGRQARFPKMVLDRTRWVVHWLPAGSRNRQQELAFSAVIELGRLGLLRQIKKCKRGGCGRYFFQRMEHKGFCSADCRRRDYRSSPA